MSVRRVKSSLWVQSRLYEGGQLMCIVNHFVVVLYINSVYNAHATS